MTSRVDKILLVSIDCWRYDALSRTNPCSFNTPKFDVLTRDYSLAERFFVAAPATRPSHTSLFTGLYPFEHGLFGQTYLKMFAGIPNLLQVLADAGFAVTARSERADVFRFLDFEHFIEPLDPAAGRQHLGSLENLIGALEEQDDGQPHVCFLHFWYTHGGYGTGGLPNPPDLRALVEDGRADEALRFFYAAVTHVQEFLLVEILKHIPLDSWAVFLFGDHGEGFSPEVMSHGDRLHENVVHVPLLAHVPGDPVIFPPGPCSMIDLFPTIAQLAGLEVDYRGYGRSLLETPAAQTERWVLTELDSLFGVGFLHAGNLETAHERVTSPTAIDGAELDRPPGGTRMWSVTDGAQFFREDELSGEFVLRNIATGDDLSCDDPGFYRRQRDELMANTAYRHLQTRETTPREERILADRLRDLGYID